MRGSRHTLLTRWRAGARSNARKPRRVRYPGAVRVRGLGRSHGLRARSVRTRSQGARCVDAPPLNRGGVVALLARRSKRLARMTARGRAGNADGTAAARAGERREHPEVGTITIRLLQSCPCASTHDARGRHPRREAPECGASVVDARSGVRALVAGWARAGRRGSAECVAIESTEAGGPRKHRPLAPPLAARTAWGHGRTSGRFDDDERSRSYRVRDRCS